MAEEKKGITVKIDADLHAEVRQYIEQHGMTMAEFITLAVDDELHPKHQIKEEKEMGKMRTMAVQVPEELFQRIKDYLHRNNMSQKDFVIGLIETELDREQTERENMVNKQEEDTTDDLETEVEESETTEEADVYESDHEDEYESDIEDEDEEYSEDEDEEEVEESEGMTMSGM